MNSARPATTTSGVVPAHAPRAANPGDRAEEDKPRDASGRPAEDPAQPAVPHREPVGAADRAGAPTGRRRGSSMASWRRSTMTVRMSWSVAANRSWPTSVDRRSAASTDTSPTRCSPSAMRAGRQHDLEQSERLELQRPERHAAEDRARLATRCERAEDRGSDQDHGQQRAQPGPELDARRDERGAVAEGDRRHAEQRAAGRPLGQRSREPVRGEHAADGADDRADEQQEPELADGRTAHGRRAVDRCEQHMTHVGSFERERPASTARSQTDARRRRRRRPRASPHRRC